MRVTPACCSIAVGEEVLALEDPGTPRIDPRLVVEAEKRAASRISRIPVVAA